MKTPSPYDENQIEDRFWTPEPWDVNIPSPGFVSDFLLAFRGIEACTKYQVWAALHAVSAVVKRDAWLEWGPLERFFLNLYVFLIGPPAVKKSSIIRRTEKIFGGIADRLTSKEEQQAKKINTLHSKATPEGLVKFLKPKTFRKGTEKVSFGSNGSIIVSELATFLGKQQYNTGLIEQLTNLFDCAPFDDVMTQSRDKEILRDIYVTLIGGETPTGLAASIPEEAFGDGFLSRVIIVYQKQRTREFPFPRTVPGAPSLVELQNRLAWIAHVARGPYLLSDEVIEAHHKWYSVFWEAEVSNPDINQRGMSRYDIHLLKLATLIRIQRYEEGNTVDLQDYEEAQKLLRATTSDGFEATEGVGASKEDKLTQAIMDYIKRKKTVDRRTLLTRNSRRGFKSDAVNIAVRELIQRDEIIIKLNGNILTYPSNKGNETYIWKEHGTEETN